ncbi:hypothetical protein RND71_021991 [Anisodus tanguticus]|uniref:Uncharacterized protein n=1 Tax=Anisodus tanguticus TaxID=243964 RepID=A0AAE1RZ74_9SOLA|nr:hypothetical protein RND71_021991 [Anisodus tanguticus]
MSKQVSSNVSNWQTVEKVPPVCRRTERRLSFELKLETIEEEGDQKYGGQYCKISHSSLKLATSSSTSNRS